MAEEIKKNDVVFDNNRNSYLVTKCIDADTFRVKALVDPTVTDIKVLKLSQISGKDKNILHFKGRCYRKIGPYETIQEGAVHICIIEKKFYCETFLQFYQSNQKLKGEKS